MDGYQASVTQGGNPRLFIALIRKDLGRMDMPGIDLFSLRFSYMRILTRGRNQKPRSKSVLID